MQSKSTTGLGTQLYIGGATGSAGYASATTPVAELEKIPLDLSKWKTVATTHFQSTGETAKPTIKGLNTMELMGHFLPNDAGFTALLAAYQNGTVPYDFKIVFPIDAAEGETTTGTICTFSAFVLQLSFADITPESIIPLKVSLQLDGPENFVPGS